MREISKMVVSIVTSSILAGAASALPPRGPAHQGRGQGQDATQMLSVSGRITSVDTDSFTLQTSQNSSGQQYQETDQGRGKTMTFMIDQNTTVDGKLQVGANADVTYRQDNGNNIAVNVHVTPQS
jgi:hypothetical protein